MSILRFRSLSMLPNTTRRLFHSAIMARLPTGQHMAADGEEIEREKNKHVGSQGSKQWNEKLATSAEAGLRAEKDTRSTQDLQKETVKKAHQANEK